MTALIYVGQVSFYAFVFWAFYRLLWRQRPMLNAGRAYLLASIVLPAILPLIRLPRPESVQPVIYKMELPVIAIQGSKTSPEPFLSDWPGTLLWLYAAVLILLALLFVVRFVKANQQLKKGRLQRNAEYSLITNCEIGPGALGRRIFFPTSEVNSLILDHEIAHIRKGHFYDLWLLQVARTLFWFSPAHYLLGQELKALHEFQADQAAGNGRDTSTYINLLLAQTLGCAGPLPIAHFFSPKLLKRRIMMLQESKPRRMLLLISTVIFGVAFLSTVLFAQAEGGNKEKSNEVVVASTRTYPDIPPQNYAPRYGEVNFLGGDVVFKTVETWPKFKGSMPEWFNENLKYQSTDGKKPEYNCMVQFTVAADGTIRGANVQKSSGVPEFDAAAIRAVNAMPSWTPGMLKGKPVAVLVTAPVGYNMNDGC